MSYAREHLFKMLTAFSFDEIDQEFVDWNVFERIDCLVKKLLDSENGVKRKPEHKYLSTVCYDSFTGAEFLQALQRTVGISEIVEAIHLGNMMLCFGYIYAADFHSSPPSIKDDGTLYLFQNSSYWPSQKPDGSEEDYAVYLVKKKILAKKKSALTPKEQAYVAKLLELFGQRWGSVVEKAEEQCRALKQKKKMERIVSEREEESFWRVHRMQDDAVDVFDVGFKRFCNRYSRKELRTLSLLKSKIDYLTESKSLLRIPSSIAINNLIAHCEQHANVDVLLDAHNEAAHSSRWFKDFEPRTKTLTVLRLERWSISLRDLLSDKKGIEYFSSFLKKEFSEENLSFWLSCEDLKYSPQSKIHKEVIRIYRDFVAPGARFEINVDNEAMSNMREGIRDPSVYAFDLAQDQVFNLMSTDSYPRFLKSNDYKDLLAEAKSWDASTTRKSNNRILNAARGFVSRSSLGDIFSHNNNNKQHAKLHRSSSDFHTEGKGKDNINRSIGNTSWFFQPANQIGRCSSENDISALHVISSLGSPTSPCAINSRMKLKGLPILKLSRSITPNSSPVISPCHSGQGSRNVSPLVSPATSPDVARRFDLAQFYEKRSKQYLASESKEILLKAEASNENEITDDISNWKWHKVSHDFF